jgi:hypothetical protein
MGQVSILSIPVFLPSLRWIKKRSTEEVDIALPQLDRYLPYSWKTDVSA